MGIKIELTQDPLITSREHEIIHQCAATILRKFFLNYYNPGSQCSESRNMVSIMSIFTILEEVGNGKRSYMRERSDNYSNTNENDRKKIKLNICLPHSCKLYLFILFQIHRAQGKAYMHTLPRIPLIILQSVSKMSSCLQGMPKPLCHECD